MIQPTLFDVTPIEHIVNVASVPQRSPFRYPGGKTWLVPRIRQWLHASPSRPALFIEPFAGGGIVSLTVAAERLADHVIMVELDNDVAAVWQTILDPIGNEWLAQNILAFDLTHEHVKTFLACVPTTVRERALQTIVKNRTVHGGILAPGSGLLKRGEDGRGIASRWYPQTLAHRIRALLAYRERLTFIHGDGLATLDAYTDDDRAMFFIDPPYTVAGKGKRAGRRLYLHHTLDHARLFHTACHLQGDFLMTYDDALAVREMAAQQALEAQAVAMKNTHHAKMNELLIGRNLACLGPHS